MVDPFAPVAGEPVSIVIGKFVAWTITDDFDASLYSLKYQFGPVVIDGVNDGRFWTFTATGEQTSALKHGRNIADLIITRISDAESRVVRVAHVQCFSDADDRRSHAQLMVDKIESVIAGRADQDVDSYTIKTRSITKMPISELTKWRDYYLAELGREPDPITGRRPKHNTLMIGFR